MTARTASLSRLAPALLVAVALLPGGAKADTIATVGEPPPLFELADETGEVHRLEDLLGQPTVLYFTHNMCHYCSQIIGFLKDTRARHSPDELAILTVNVWADGPKLISRYKEQFGLTFPMVAGKDPDLLREYEVNYVPIIIFLDLKGKIHEIYHHYVLKADFDESVNEVIEGLPPGPSSH